MQTNIPRFKKDLGIPSNPA